MITPNETVREVESEYQQRLDQIIDECEWLSEHPPECNRFSVQFEESEIDREEPIVRLLQQATRERIDQPEIDGFTGGTDV